MTKSFPKIFQLGTKYIKDIFDGDVEITEKIDGSQFNFGKTDGKVWMKSKNKEVFHESPNMFKLASEYLASMWHLVPDNTAFHCEYLMKPKHNVLNYGRVPRNNLMCFGVSTPDEVFIKGYQELADNIGLESVPLIYYGRVDSMEELEKYLLMDSVLGMAKIEGFVVKNYTKPCFVGDRLLPITCGKFVSEKFKEKHNKDWKNEKGTKNRLLVLMENYRSEARWQKAVQCIKEFDPASLKGEPSDIGQLIRQVQTDLHDEEEQEIKDALYKLFKKDIMNKAIAGLPEWYKKSIAWESFQKGSDANVIEDGSTKDVLPTESSPNV